MVAGEQIGSPSIYQQVYSVRLAMRSRPSLPLHDRQLTLHLIVFSLGLALSLLAPSILALSILALSVLALFVRI